MARLPLYYYDHPILRKRALPIEEITPEIVQLAQDMIETMIASRGVGIAAPQVGKSLRICIIRDEKLDANDEYVLGPPEVLINPKLSNPSKEKDTMVDGCLSIPGIHFELQRPKSIHVSYQNLKGEWIEEDFHGFRAWVTMHENDHLNGVLIIDRASNAVKKKIEPQLLAIKKRYPTGLDS